MFRKIFFITSEGKKCQLVDTALSQVTSESWQNAVGYVIREELRMQKLNRLSDIITDQSVNQHW
jgi:hypothetical protein